MPQESFTPWFILGIELCVFIARKMMRKGYPYLNSLTYFRGCNWWITWPGCHNGFKVLYDDVPAMSMIGIFKGLTGEYATYIFTKFNLFAQTCTYRVARNFRGLKFSRISPE